MNYWIFKANPDHYRIDARLLDPAPNLIWAVTRYHDRIQKGDTVFIWRAGTPRGICAVMLIDVCPYEPQEKDLKDGYELPAGSAVPAPAHWAKGHLIKRFPIIETNIIKKIPGLDLFSFFSAFQQATNYTITRPEGARLMNYIENRPVEEPDKKRENTLKPAAKAKKAEPAPAASAKKSKPVGPAKQPSDFALLKCKTCGTYVVNSATSTHIQEKHGGQPVEWLKVK